MKRALIVATVIKFLEFEKSDIKILLDMGYEVHIAVNMHGEDWLRDDGTFAGMDVIRHQIDFGRKPFSCANIRSYRQLKRLFQQYYFDIIHCHTPVASAIARVAAITERKRGSYVIYTCHGFHFHKKSDRKSRMLYYPVERVLALITDMMIAVNKEDYHVIRSFKVRECKYIPGVGVDTAYIHKLKADRAQMLSQFGIPQDAFVVLSIGELSARKNQSVIIEALAKLRYEDIYYIICGCGEKYHMYKMLAREKGIGDRVVFTGHKDHEWVMRLCHAVDLGAIPSVIEGLGLAGIEMLAAGLPLVGANIHGINDYLIFGETGFSCPPNDADGFAQAIRCLYKDKQIYHICAENALKTAEKFDIKRSRRLMKENYKVVLEHTRTGG